MDIQGFFTSLLNVVCEMAPYLLLGFFIAGVLHVFVPQKFYANYLSRCVRYQVLTYLKSNYTLTIHQLLELGDFCFRFLNAFFCMLWTTLLYF